MEKAKESCMNVETVNTISGPSFFWKNGHLVSSLFDDIYHNQADCFGQANYVFINGTSFPDRIKALNGSNKDSFCILEIGFGAGINFIVSLQNWLRESRQEKNLRYVGIEKYPFSIDQIKSVYAELGFCSSESSVLLEHWPDRLTRYHETNFLFPNKGSVTLCLYHADAASVVQKNMFSADAVYLDGFSPSKNPDLWSLSFCAELFRNTSPGGVLATYSSAGWVRRNLQEVGFDVVKAKGFLNKRSHLIAIRL